MKKLAVIMSIYKNDTKEYVSLAVESLLKQTFSIFDLYIQYDGEINKDIDFYLTSLNDNRLHIFKRLDNKGLAHSLNDLLYIVIPKGYEFIARMDADDICMLDRFEKQINYLIKHQDIDCLGGAITVINQNGKSKKKTIAYPCDPINTKKFFKKRNPLAHPTVMMRRSFFDKIGEYYSTEYERNEDTMLWYKGFLNGAKIANLPDVILMFRMTNAMFKQRRNGKAFAKSQLKMRKMINKNLQYGLSAQIYAYSFYLLMILPSWLIKIAYKILR